LAVYYVVGNMSKKYWSELKFIHLCILVPYRLLKEYNLSYDALFAPLLTKLKVLVTRVKASVGGSVHKFYAAQATFSADNLTAHTIAKFQHHFPSGRICRCGMAINNAISSSFREDTFNLRTEAAHGYLIEALEANVSNGSVES